MPDHASFNPSLVRHKPRDRGAAYSHVFQGRRTTHLEGNQGFIGVGATVTQVTIQTNPSPLNYYPGIVYDENGLRAYNANAIETFAIDAADGSLTVLGTGAITGGTIETSAYPPRVVLDPSGLTAYDQYGNAVVQVGSDGSFQLSAPHANLTTYSAGVIISSGAANIPGAQVVIDSRGVTAYNVVGSQTAKIGTDGTFSLSTINASITAYASGVIVSSGASTVTGARVVIDATGIKGYNASNVQEFLLDSASGLIQATGVIQSQPGSTVPWQTTGFFVGGGNLLSNSSAEDPTTTTQRFFMTTGVGVTAGTFALQYGSNTPTAAIAYNATATTVQSALNVSGVLPAGVTASVSGGPLPGTNLIITLAGCSTPAPSLLSVVSSSLAGGSGMVGAVPVSWSYDSNALGFIQYAQAFHGGNVFRLTAQSAGQSPYMYQTLGPIGWTPGTTNYTMSAYVTPATTPRSAQLYLNWVDSSQGTVQLVPSTTVTTVVGQWTRLVLTATVPVAATRQQITITGAPNGGSITLTYNGQTTTALAYNSTAAQVLSALQALSNVGTSGAAYATGGPLPGTPVNVSFKSPPAAAPATMTYTNSLTGGTSPAVNIQNLPATYVQCAVSPANNASSAEVHYVDAVQFECGDAPTAYGPRPDEIVANTVTANMINVAQLSAISANIGNITAGNITGVTITGSTIQTALANPKMILTSASFQAINSTGTIQMYMDPTYGLALVGSRTVQSSITWAAPSALGTQQGYIICYPAGSGYTPSTTLAAGGSGSNGIAYLTLNYQGSTGSGSSNSIAFGGNNLGDWTLVNDATQSCFLQCGNGPTLARAGIKGQYAINMSLGAGAEATATVTDGTWDLITDWWTVLGYFYSGGKFGGMDKVTWSVIGNTRTSITLNFSNYGAGTASGYFYFNILYQDGFM